MNVRKIKRAWSYIKIRSSEFFRLWSNYSFSFAFWGGIWWICFYGRFPFNSRLSTFALKRKTTWLNKYIERKYVDIISVYQNNPPVSYPIDELNIWVFWGQGEANMPPLVKACYKQLCHFNENVKLVTLNNLEEYISLPQPIIENVERGCVSWAHFSDIVRNTLLAQHGGLWLDATIWVSGKLPITEIREMSIYSANFPMGTSKYAVRYWSSFDCNWNSCCLCTNQTNYILYSFVSKMLQEIAVRESYWPDYVIQDYLIYYASTRFPKVREDFLRMKFSNPQFLELSKMMNLPYCHTKYKQLLKTDFVFKLSFRSPWNLKTTEGLPTFYGRILQDIIDPL